MSWYAIYQLEDGRLVSGTGDPAQLAAPDILAARGYDVKEFADGVNRGAWNPQTLEFDPPPDDPVMVDPEAIIAAFPPDRWAAAKALNDPVVTWFFDRLMARREPINIAGETFQQGMQLLIGHGILTPQEVMSLAAALGAG